MHNLQFRKFKSLKFEIFTLFIDVLFNFIRKEIKSLKENIRKLEIKETMLNEKAGLLNETRLLADFKVN